MRKMLVMTSTFACPYGLSGWRCAGKKAFRDGSVPAIFLVIIQLLLLLLLLLLIIIIIIIIIIINTLKDRLQR